MQGLCYTSASAATPSSGIPGFCKRCCANGVIVLFNGFYLGICLREMRKSDQYHRASVVAHVTKHCVRTSGRGANTKIRGVFPYQPSKRGGPTLIPYGSGKEKGDSVERFSAYFSGGLETHA